MTSESSKNRRGLIVDAILLTSVLLLGSVLLQPGVLTVDESHYLLAASAAEQHTSFRIENGYERYLAPQLLFFYTVVPQHLDRTGTVSTVPPFHAFLAIPFLHWGGLPGLYWLNLISFALSTVAVRRLSARILPSMAFGVGSAALFAFGTFGLEYALGIWPHALSQGFVLWGLLALLRASDKPLRGAEWMMVSGLLFGIAVGVRLQNIIWLPVLGFAARQWLHISYPKLLAHLSGWLLPLLGIAWINDLRLGQANPFSYGAPMAVSSMLPASGWTWLLPIVAGYVLAIYLPWFWDKLGPWRLRALAMTVILLLLAVALLPAAQSIAARFVCNSGFHFLDSSFLPLDQPPPGANRNALGQVFYGGVLKKGLFEVAPFLILSTLWFLRRRLNPDAPAALVFLSGAAWLTGAGFMLIVSSGGLCFNPRYLLECVPLFLIASLYWAMQLRISLLFLAVGGLGGLLLALPAVLAPGAVGQLADGWWPMLMPLCLASILVGTTLLALWRSAPWSRLANLARSAGAVLAGAALGYGAAVGWGVDLQKSMTIRNVAARMAEEGQQALPDHSMLLAWEARKDVFSPLKLNKDILIAGLGANDDNIPRLLELALAQRRVFVLKNGVPDELWQRWTQPYRIALQERRGLVFAELKSSEPGP